MSNEPDLVFRLSARASGAALTLLRRTGLTDREQVATLADVVAGSDDLPAAAALVTLAPPIAVVHALGVSRAMDAEELTRRLLGSLTDHLRERGVSQIVLSLELQV